MLKLSVVDPVKSLVKTTSCLVVLIGGGCAHATMTPPSLCSLANAPQNDLVMQVPFEVVDGRIYVQARVNDRGPFRFALDTGASGLGRADTSLVSALGLRIEEPTINSDGVKTAEVDTTRIRTLSVGGLSRKNLQVITRDYNSNMSSEAAFSGIVAREFFDDGLLMIDYPTKTISFSRKLALSPNQEGVIGYERPFRIPVTISGVKTEGNLDTGANVTFVMPQSMYEKVADARLQDAGQGQLANSKVETKISKVHGPFQIGEVRLWDVEVRVSEHYPELLVGAHALQGLTILIDQRSKSVALCP